MSWIFEILTPLNIIFLKLFLLNFKLNLLFSYYIVLDFGQNLGQSEIQGNVKYNNLFIIYSIFFNFSNNLVWITLSYAFFKSINTKYLLNLFLSFLTSFILSFNLNKFNSVPHPFINPICLLHNIFLLFISSNNLVY